MTRLTAMRGNMYMSRSDGTSGPAPREDTGRKARDMAAPFAPEGTFTDIFCGAGGSSIGLTEAGLEQRLAANHWQRAIDTHAANFPGAEHLCADVNNYDFRRLPRTQILWASPICTEGS